MANYDEMDTQNKNTNQVSLKSLLAQLPNWWHYYKSNWKIFIVVIIICGLLGFLYSHYKKTVYIATCTFVLDDGSSGGSFAQYAGLASMAGLDIGGSKNGLFQSDNIIELYKSKKMIEKTLLSPLNKSEQLLIDRYISFKHLKEIWKTNLSLQDLKFNQLTNDSLSRLQDSVVKEAIKDINKNYLTVGKINDNASIIKVETKVPDELFAKEFNDKIVSNVNDFYMQTKTKITLQNVHILQHQTDSVRGVLNGAINQSVAINDATPNLNITRQTLRVPAQRAQLSAEANKAILSELVKNLELAKITLHKETPLIQVVDTPSYPLEKNELRPVFAIVVASLAGILLTAFCLFFKKLFKEAINQSTT